MDAKGSTQRGGAAFLTRQVVGRWLFLCRFLARQISNLSVHGKARGLEILLNHQSLCCHEACALEPGDVLATQIEMPVL